MSGEQKTRWAMVAAGLVGSVVAIMLASYSAAVASPLASPGTKVVSTRYGYSIVLPSSFSRWNRRLATVSWTSDSIGGLDSPEMDAFTDQQTERVYLLAARPSTSLQRWTAFVVAAHPSVCGRARFLPDSTLAGTQARVHTVSCTDGYRVFVITAVRAHRGYMLLVASPTTLSRTSDLRAFDAARRSFQFLHKQ